MTRVHDHQKRLSDRDTYTAFPYDSVECLQCIAAREEVVARGGTTLPTRGYDESAEKIGSLSSSEMAPAPPPYLANSRRNSPLSNCMYSYTPSHLDGSPG